jgi:transposase
MAIPAQYTSQDCSGYGTSIPKSLSVRTPVGTSCGRVLERDEHAARNLPWAGQALRGLVGVPAGTNRASVGL